MAGPSDENPYLPPKAPSATPFPPPRPLKAGPYVMGILLLVGMIPASGVAFFCCCLAGLAVTDGPPRGGVDPFTIGLIFGTVGGLLVFVGMLAGAIWLVRRANRVG